MREGKLPVIDGDVGISGVLDVMRAENTNALVVRRGDRHDVLTSRRVMAAWNVEVEAGREPDRVTSGDMLDQPVVPAPRHVAAQDWDFDAPVPGGLDGGTGPNARHLAAAFDRFPGDVIVVQHRGPRARIVMRSAMLGASYGGPYSACVCEGSPVHRFPPEDLEKPGECIFPHGARAKCG